jgi:TolB protein
LTLFGPPRPPRPDDPIERDELEALVQALIEEARRRARRRRRIYAGVGLLIAFAGLAIFTILDHTTPSHAASPALASGSGSTLASAKPRLAFASSRSGWKRGAIYVINADGSGRRRVTHYGGWGSDLAWSPDGNELAFTRGYPWTADIFVVRADGSRERRLRIPGHEGGLVWSPDGRRIAFTRWYGQKDPESEFRVINADGTSMRLLSRDAVGMSWSPDGRKLVFIGTGPGRPNVYVINVDGSDRRSLTRIAGYEDSDSFSWSPDGRRIAFVRHPECLRCSALEKAGMGNPNAELWVMRADGSGRRRLASGHGMQTAGSPDSEMLAYQSFYRPRPNTPGLRFLKVNELFVVRADGSGKRRLTNGGGPLWSPDGQQIAFVRWPGGTADLYVMNSDGSGQRRLTKTPGYGEITYAWSNAGTK